MPTRIDTQDILDLTIRTDDISASAVTPDKASLTASWDFGQGVGATLFYKTPVSASEVAVKSYVDGVAAGARDPKDAVRVAASGNITLSGLQTIDDIALADGDRILVFGQTLGEQNGIYEVTSTAWSRSSDADEDSEVTQGLYTLVATGTNFEGIGFVLTTEDPITVDVTTQSYVQFSALGKVTAGAGLTKTNNTLDVGAGYGIVVNADNVQVDPAVVGDLTGTNSWTGTNVFSDISGTLLLNGNGDSYLVAGDNVNIDSGSGQQVIISAITGTSTFDPDASYLVVSLTSSLNQERQLTSSLGISIIDGGANSTFDIQADASVLPFLSGNNTYTGINYFSGTAQLSGTLFHNANGDSLFVQGDNFVLIDSSSDQQIVFSLDVGNLAGEFGDRDASYVVLGLTSSLSNERLLTSSTGITITDGGANGNVTVGVDSGTLVTFDQSTYNEVPSGTVDGVNDTFSLLNAPTITGTIRVYKRGLRMKEGDDYILSSTVSPVQEFVVFQAGSVPTPGSNLLVDYWGVN